MEFFGTSQEYLLVTNYTSLDAKKINENNTSTLSVLWNRNKDTNLLIDNVNYVLKTNEMIFLTEFHNVDISEIDEISIIRFNRDFYCIGNHDSEIGCKGVLFFGASQVPIIYLDDENKNKFEILWNVFLTELKSKDELQIEMLQMLLKRLLILATRLYKLQNKVLNIQDSKFDTIRDFNYLVEMHFKSKHTVSEYASIMNKPAKSLTNLFAVHIDKSPLQIIQDRIFLEARRILMYSDKSIKETTYELGFEDIQSFSRFFKNKQGISPRDFRENKEFKLKVV